MAAPDGALSGLRVVEIAHERGAFAGKLLADMGAEVVVVEPPGGVAMRRYPPFADDEPGPERSLVWWHYNTSKLGVTLDLDTARGQELFRALVATADIVLEAEDPGRLAALGLGPADLATAKPELIVVSITPFGQSGPRSDELATDLTVLASGGPAWMNGYDDHTLPPVRGGGNQGYQTGCHFAVMSALTALLVRDQTGEGQHIDVNLHAASNVTTESGSYVHLVAGQTVHRQTGRHAAVRQTMESQIECADGRYVNTGILPRTPREFRGLHDWMVELGFEAEFPEIFLLKLATEREFLDLGRIGEDEELTAIFGAAREAIAFIASRLPAYDFFHGGQSRGIPLGIIYSPEEVMEDPHYKARGFPVEVEHTDIDRTVVYPGAPYRFSASPWRIARRAPHIGEHNEEVLGAVGVSARDFSKLRADGVI